MTLKSEHEKDIVNDKNVIPLGNEEIKSFLKRQSEAVFEDKNLSNNSNFVKKSLNDIAIDFENDVKDNSPRETSFTEINKLDESEIIDKDKIVSEVESEDENQLLKKDDFEEQLNEKIENDQKIKTSKSIINESNEKNTSSLENTNSEIESEGENNTSDNEKLDKDHINNIALEDNPKVDDDIIQSSETNEEETQQALDSVRDAVSQSIGNNDKEIFNNDEERDNLAKDYSNIISDELENIKNIFSSISNISEQSLYKVIESKIIEIASDLAGYQIDKMPEKYQKKIKSFLKNINCFEEKISIELNDKDFEAISKIEDFNNFNKNSKFIANKDISRGDIILNCDGMYYSEKTVKL